MRANAVEPRLLLSRDKASASPKAIRADLIAVVLPRAVSLE